jgi:hypothetical protein
MHNMRGYAAKCKAKMRKRLKKSTLRGVMRKVF